ncbi:phenylacetate--CoA ligase family protein [Umezawaea endophytica]|uniref:Phenylacetate--CoA ligase family protein n=1 Tax=Umezawaea endophytica TaxID=1654476 RepID=A0A9X2VR61_9PSEU|nr:phenylacetate--CoA ligase family protein [Umezawaea endophytica]MCS7481129.1 phenylacetate--CoA ligase family protein [Umezawaea endophytica]
MSDRLADLVRFARDNSPFYRDLYRDVPEHPRLVDLPIVEQAGFWAANTVRGNQVLTGPQTGGIIFKTGGTTSAPRVSVYTREEWRDLAATFASGLADAGLRPGDRVANLYHAGELYSGFILVLNALQEALVDTVQLPIAGTAPPEFTVQTLRDFSATVLAGFPTSLCRLARYVVDQVGALPDVRLVLFSGEAFYDDQRGLVATAFPNADLRSIGYGSVDGGILAGPVADHPDVRVLRAFRPGRVLEVVDVDTGEPIEEPGRPGRLLVTDLTRRLLPILRYPVGDLAEWVDFDGGVFRLLGRAGEGARVGHVTLHHDQLRTVVDAATREHRFTGFQVVLRRRAAKDELVLRVACDATDRAGITQVIESGVDEISPRFADQVRQGVCLPLAVEWSALVTNPRTGKLLRVIDERPVQATRGSIVD